MARLENSMKKSLLKSMGTAWDVQSHEDKYTIGIPDLSYGVGSVQGWMELKQVKEWPKDENGLVIPEHYTTPQVNWLRKRGKKGGHCYVMVRVAREYNLFGWWDARRVKNGMTRAEYNERCIFGWGGIPPTDQLIEQISRPGTQCVICHYEYPMEDLKHNAVCADCYHSHSGEELIGLCMDD